MFLWVRVRRSSLNKLSIWQREMATGWYYRYSTTINIHRTTLSTIAHMKHIAQYTWLCISLSSLRILILSRSNYREHQHECVMCLIVHRSIGHAPRTKGAIMMVIQTLTKSIDLKHNYQNEYRVQLVSSGLGGICCYHIVFHGTLRGMITFLPGLSAWKNLEGQASVCILSGNLGVILMEGIDRHEPQTGRCGTAFSFNSHSW